MTEIVVDITSVGILHIEIGFLPTFSRHDRIEASFILFIWLNEKVLIALGHRMNLWDMGNHMDTFCHLAGLVYQDKSVVIYFWPLSSNAMQIPSLRKEFSAHGVGRDDDLSLLIML